MVHMNRPHKRNAFDRAMLAELAEHVIVRRTRQARVVTRQDRNAERALTAKNRQKKRPECTFGR